MKRRSFLKAASSISLPVMINGLGISSIAKSTIFDYANSENDRILVLIQCNGGYDGLAMLHPLEQYDQLATWRSNILIPESQTLQIQDRIGLHPAMEGFANMYAEQKINFIQAVGYPDQNRSHFRSKDIWTSGSAANEYETTGWFGRYLDTQYPGYPMDYPNEEYPDPFAITIGNAVSSTCQGIASNFSMAINDPFNLVPLTISAGGEVPDSYYGDQIAFLRDAILKSNEYADIITKAADLGANTIEYPQSNLARQLQTVALLISGGLKSKIYVVNIGGFDTHANQAGNDAVDGLMNELLTQLSEAMQAFQNDLLNLQLEERVLSLTFTEFGRRIKSNGSLGTDHGSAAPLILQGACVNHGILGDSSVIPDEIDNSTGVPMQFDFRSVYGSILIDWFEVPELEVRTLLFDDFQYLPIIRNCNAISTANGKIKTVKMDLRMYPNPGTDQVFLDIDLPTSQNLQIDIMNGTGQMLNTVRAGRLSAGMHHIPLPISEQAAGTYWISVRTEEGQITKQFIKSR